MLEQVLSGAAAVIAGLLATLWPAVRTALREAAAAAAQRALADLQLRLGEGAGRVAGELLATARADGLTAVPPALIDQGAAMLKARYAETVTGAKISDSTLVGMVAGELGKLGAAVLRR